MMRLGIMFVWAAPARLDTLIDVVHTTLHAGPQACQARGCNAVLVWLVWAGSGVHVQWTFAEHLCVVAFTMSLRCAVVGAGRAWPHDFYSALDMVDSVVTRADVHCAVPG